MKRRAAVICSLVMTVGYAYAQGSLTPPGVPAAMMKTLEQVEPRIDVMTLAGDASSEIVITNSGSYYLSANLAVTKDNGISIQATDVTLDLNGFNVSRISGSGGIGILINSLQDRATVRNGTVVGFEYGIRCYFSPALAKGCLFEKLALSGCSTYGIYAGISSRIVDCRVHDNAGSGIYSAAGNSISGCTVYNNQGTYGIYASGSTLRGCSAYSTTGTGSSSYGIYADNGSSILECVSRGNSNTNSLSTSSQGVGIYAGSRGMIKDCTATQNKGDGILIAADILVEGNMCSGNGFIGDGAGIHAAVHFTSAKNQIDGNTVTGNDRGIDVDSYGNLIVRNSANGNTTEYDIVGGNDVGSIQTSPIGSGAWDNIEL
jgi:parallel beta-helix repeat protein